MPRLFVLSGDDVGRTYDFESAVELGRSKELGVPLRSTSVSRRHARIEQRDGRWYVVDLDSRNGVFLNGVGVERAELEDGAVFVLGRLELRFRLEASETPIPTSEPEPEPERSAVPDNPVVELELDLGLEDDKDGDDEIDLEGDWSAEPPSPGSRVRHGDPELGATTTVSGALPERGPESAARISAGTAARAAALGGRPAASERATHSGGRILQYNKVPDRAGILHADLGQQSFLVRSLLYLLGLGVFLAIGYGMYRLVATLREQAQPVAPIEER